MSANDPGQTPHVEGSRVEGWSRDLPAPRVALAIGAHPDDVEFGCGGTLAKWSAAGTVVHHLVLTDGSKGTWDPNADALALVAARAHEQRAAAAALGATGTVSFAGYVDGELPHCAEATSLIALAIRTLRPGVVLTHDPWKRYRLHPDHRNAGLNVCDAVVAARDPHFLREQLIDGITHHRPDALVLWEADEPNHVEDITDWFATKIAALECHASQFESTMKATDDAGFEAFRSRIASRAADLGRPHGLASAEIFHAMTRL